MRSLVPAERRPVVTGGGELTGQGERPHDGQGGAVAEQRDGGRGVTEQRYPAVRPAVQAYLADGVEEEVVGGPYVFEQFSSNTNSAWSRLASYRIAARSPRGSSSCSPA
ncbi:MAG TPA: hypothetical protein VGD53_02745 [Actinoallomurus sp.]